MNAGFVSRPNVKHGKAIFCFIYKQVIARVTGNTKPSVGGLLISVAFLHALRMEKVFADRI